MKFSEFTASTPDWTPEEAVSRPSAHGNRGRAALYGGYLPRTAALAGLTAGAGAR